MNAIPLVLVKLFALTIVLLACVNRKQKKRAIADLSLFELMQQECWQGEVVAVPHEELVRDERLWPIWNVMTTLRESPTFSLDAFRYIGLPQDMFRCYIEYLRASGHEIPDRKGYEVIENDLESVEFKTICPILGGVYTHYFIRDPERLTYVCVSCMTEHVSA